MAAISEGSLTDNRGDVAVDDGHFHMADFVGDDAETGHFTRRAGGGVDGDQWHLWFGGLVHAFVVADVPTVGGAQGNALGAVMGGTAAQGNNEITVAAGQQFQALFHVADGRIRFGAIKQGGVDVLLGQQAGDLGRHAGFGQAGIGDDQGFAESVLADCEHRLVEAANAHHVHGRNEEGATHDKSSFYYGDTGVSEVFYSSRR